MTFQDYFNYIIEHANSDEIPERFHTLLNSEPSQKQLNYAQYLMDMLDMELTKGGSSPIYFGDIQNIMNISEIISDFDITVKFLDCLESKSQLVISEIISVLLEEGTLIDYITIYNKYNQRKGSSGKRPLVLDDMICTPITCTPMTVREHMKYMGYYDKDFREKPTKNQINYLRMLLNEKYYKYFSLYSSKKGRFGELKNYMNMFKDFPKPSDTDDYLIQHFSKCEVSEMIDFVKGQYYISDYRHAFKEK